MSRSPLFEILKRCLNTARLSQQTGRPAAELIGEAREADRRRRQQRAEQSASDGLSRRGFLAAGAVGLGGLGTLSCVSAAPKADGPAAAVGQTLKVLVVGAGIAGLTAAYRLKQAGVAVKVAEAQERIGGRMFSGRNLFADNQVCEIGGELIDSDHETIRGLAKELNIPVDDCHADHTGLSPDTMFFEGKARTGEELIAAFKPLAEKMTADLKPLQNDKGELKEISAANPNGGEKLDRLSIAEYLDKAGCSGWFRKVLDVAYTTEYGLDPGQQSSLNLLSYIDSNPEAKEFKIFGESDERYHVQGGNDRIPAALAEKLKNEIELGLILEAVKKRADGAIVCTFRKGRAVGAPSVELTAEHVVLALPFTLLRSVTLDAGLELPAAKLKAIKEQGYGNNTKLMIGFTERAWRTKSKAAGGFFTDLLPQSGWETSRAQPGTSGLITNYTGGAHALTLNQKTAKERAAEAVAELDKMWPGVAAVRAGAKEVMMHWPSNPWVKASYSSLLVGQWTSLGGVAGEKVGQLHFAGEHCSVDYLGYMEGGAETGEAVAKEVLEDLGIKVPAKE